MRNVKSANYFEQMKGRGSRVIGADDLKGVTPDADTKTRFVIVDAVGLTEHDKTETQPLDRRRSVLVERLMQSVAEGSTDPNVVSTLAARLAALDLRLGDEDRREISSVAGKDLKALAHNLLGSLDPDAQERRAAEISGLTEDEEPTEAQVREAEEAMIVEALSPLYDPRLRRKILDAKSSSEQVIDETTPDELLAGGYDEDAAQKARDLIGTFERFIEENREEIEALQVLYSRPYRAGLRYGQIKALARTIERPPLAATPEALWRAYEAVEPSTRNRKGGNQLADLVSLVRHAIDHAQPLAVAVEERYEEWLADQEAAGARLTDEQRRWLDAIKDHVATSLRIERGDFDYPPLSQLGCLGGVYQAYGDDLPRLLDELNEILAA